MQPFVATLDESYRQYALGVAYEAMGYDEFKLADEDHDRPVHALQRGK